MKGSKPRIQLMVVNYLILLHLQKNTTGNYLQLINVGGLSQLHEDILFNKKRLDKISSFAFENFMQTIKKYVRSSSNPIIQ